MQPPNGFGASEGASSTYSTPDANQGHHLRSRGAMVLPPHRYSNVFMPIGVPGVLPTPDPTIASCISDEDVAMQLMRLGDPANMSNATTRHSTSTQDDALSGVADIASSGGDSESEGDSDGTEQPLPAHPEQESQMSAGGALRKKHKHLDDILPSFDSTEPSGDERDDDYEDPKGSFKTEYNEADTFMHELAQAARKSSKAKSVVSVDKSRNNSAAPKTKKARPNGLAKSKSKSKGPSSIAATGGHARKQSTASTITFSHQLADGEEDLSSKPRCQRCRTSKKGCDRQRPCGRCKDAGIGIEGCISEDEGNGRKGRFGRHMGVSIKKPDGTDVSIGGSVDGDDYAISTTSGPSMPVLDHGVSAHSPDKSKKRKRSAV
jgi:hypothetical protein